MEFCVWLPWEPWLHHDPRVVHEPKVVDVSQLQGEHQAIDGHKEEWGYDGHIQEWELDGAHGHCWVSSRRVIPVERGGTVKEIFLDIVWIATLWNYATDLSQTLRGLGPIITEIGMGIYGCVCTPPCCSYNECLLLPIL